MSSLSKVDTTHAEHKPILSCPATDKDFCLLDDELSNGGGSHYVNLLRNVERFTGYTGYSAHRVWRSIYEENCFNLYTDQSKISKSGSALGSGLSVVKDISSSWGGVSSGGGGKESLENMCLEKRVFYRLISGLHTSISTHICDEYLDRTTGEWHPNLDCFMQKVSNHPERVKNIYFTYIFYLRAILKLGPYLNQETFCTGDQKEEKNISSLIQDIITIASSSPSTFDEHPMFTDDSLKTEFRDHFRNISRIMDCVACEKCKLWGKLQITGMGVGMKVLFSFDDEG